MKSITFYAALALCAAAPAFSQTTQDSCNAAEAQYLIGQIASKVPDLDSMGRVWFPGSAGTMDYLPYRRNITVDEQDVITNVYCG